MSLTSREAIVYARCSLREASRALNNAKIEALEAGDKKLAERITKVDKDVVAIKVDIDLKLEG